MVLVVATSACGRFGFEPTPTTDAPSIDAAFDPSLVLWLDMETTAPGPVVGGHVECPQGCPALTAGQHGNGYRLDGSSWLEVEVPAGLPITAYTWSAWVRPAVVAGFHAVVESRSLELDLEDGGLVSWINDAPLIRGGALTAGTWVHLALTRDGDQLALFVDAAPIGVATDPNVHDFGPCEVLVGIDSDNGCDGALNGELIGDLDEVRIYARALSPAELAADRASPTPLPR